MPRIKIISNPYENVITYQKYNSNSGDWESIDANSDLWKEKYKNSVFPFVVKNIVDVIFNEFKSGNEQINILFEETDDEFKELESVCHDEEYNGLLHPVISLFKDLNKTLKPIYYGNDSYRFLYSYSSESQNRHSFYAVSYGNIRALEI